MIWSPRYWHRRFAWHPTRVSIDGRSRTIWWEWYWWGRMAFSGTQECWECPCRKPDGGAVSGGREECACPWATQDANRRARNARMAAK